MSITEATESNNKEEVERLLRSGADINQRGEVIKSCYYIIKLGIINIMMIYNLY